MPLFDGVSISFWLFLSLLLLMTISLPIHQSLYLSVCRFFSKSSQVILTYSAVYLFLSMCTLNRYFLTVYLCHRVSTYVSLSAYKCLLFSFTLAIFLCCWLHFVTYFPFICSFRMQNEIKFIFHFESHSEIDISEFGYNQRIRKCKIYARQKLLSFFSLSLSLHRQ